MQVRRVPRQVVASQPQQLAERARAERLAAQPPADDALQRQRRFEHALLVATDHALGDVVAQLFQLAGQACLAAGRARALALALAQLAQTCSDAAFDRRPARDLDFVAIRHRSDRIPLARWPGLCAPGIARRRAVCHSK